MKREEFLLKGSVMRFVVFLMLLLIWLGLSGMYDAFHIALGMFCSGLVTFWGGRLWMNQEPKVMLENAISLVFYTPWLLWQIVLSNLQVMKLVFHPGLKEVLKPTIVCFSASDLDNNWARYMLANSITLTPGTVTVMVSEDGRFLCHAINEDAAAGLPQPMLDKVRRAFNTSSRD
jgi:multicomponent Na+:H+ antiporter subunit E